MKNQVKQIRIIMVSLDVKEEKMIRYLEGDIFKSPAQTIVNTVNTVGVMGKGIALAFKERYPEMFEEYKRKCEKKELTTGKLMIWNNAPDHKILLFPTKEHWRSPSKIEYIEKGLEAFSKKYLDMGITSIAFPKLGTGNGGLKWEDVQPVMEKYLKPLVIDIYIYIGDFNVTTPEHKKQKETLEWLRAHAKDMSFRGLQDDLASSYSLLPGELKVNNKNWTVRWSTKGELIFLNLEDKREKIIDEDELSQIWDFIRNKKIFGVDENLEDKIFIYELLKSKGYLTEVRIRNKDTEEMHQGYQLDKGLGRLYSLRG